jgi:hypothetical protein
VPLQAFIEFLRDNLQPIGQGHDRARWTTNDDYTG